MKPLDDDDLILYLYGESADPEEVREALESSPELRARCESLRLVLAAVDGALPVPERGEGYGAEVWARLAPRLAEHLHDRLELALIAAVLAGPAAGQPELREQIFRPLRMGEAGLVVASPVVLPELRVGRAEHRAAADEPVAAVRLQLRVALGRHVRAEHAQAVDDGP